MEAQKHWGRLNGLKLAAKVVTVFKFVNGGMMFYRVTCLDVWMPNQGWKAGVDFR